MKRWPRKTRAVAMLISVLAGALMPLTSARAQTQVPGVASTTPGVTKVLRPRGAIGFCVNPGGTAGCASSISAAVARITERNVVIDVAAGTYHDNVSIDTGLTGLMPTALNLTVIGTSGAATTVIDGGAAGPIFTIGPKANVTLIGLTITGGTGGLAEGDHAGGGILATGATLTINDCEVDSNQAGNGAGIYASDGNLTITNSSVTNNLGQGNGAAGGGIFFTSTRSHRLIPYKLTILRSTIDSNSATSGGGVSVSGWDTPIWLSAEITDSVISNNVSNTTGDEVSQGGGLWSSFAKLTITDTTISGNNAAGVGIGGAILSLVSDAILNNVTIANNSAGSGGGGIGGVFAEVISANAAAINKLRFVISNSIVAGNHAPESPDCQSGSLPIISHDYNFFGDVTGCTLRGKTAHSILYGDPMLGPLMSNGGTTDTQALLPASLALGAGNPGVPNGKDGHCTAIDQIGTARSKGNCDMGAYQLPN